MIRSNSLDAATRSFVGLIRGVLVKANDATKLQGHDVRMFHNQLIRGMERFQAYGHMAVPLPIDEDGKGAEVIVGFLGGNQSHPVVLAVDDRRHRPTNWKEGESGSYDDQGQTVRISRDGIVVDGGPSKKPVTLQCGGSSVKLEDGKVTITATKIIFKGRVELGDEGGPAVETVSGPASKAFAV